MAQRHWRKKPHAMLSLVPKTIEIQEGRGIDGCVLLDCRHIKDRILEAFHQIFRTRN